MKIKKAVSFLTAFTLILSVFLFSEGNTMISEAAVQHTISNYESYIQINQDQLFKDVDLQKVDTGINQGQNYELYTYEMAPVSLQSINQQKDLNAKTVLFEARASGGSKTDYDTDKYNIVQGTLTIYYEQDSSYSPALTRLTKVSGSNKIVGNSSGMIFTGQKVSYGMFGTGSAAVVDESRERTLSSQAASFSFNTGFTGAIALGGTYNIGATYEISLKYPAYNESWKLTVESKL